MSSLGRHGLPARANAQPQVGNLLCHRDRSPFSQWESASFNILSWVPSSTMCVCAPAFPEVSSLALLMAASGPRTAPAPHLSHAYIILIANLQCRCFYYPQPIVEKQIQKDIKWLTQGHVDSKNQSQNWNINSTFITFIQFDVIAQLLAQILVSLSNFSVIKHYFLVTLSE